MKSTPVAKGRTPKDPHHDTDVTLFSAPHCQTDIKGSRASTEQIPSRFLSPKGQTMFKMDAQRKSLVFTDH